METSYNETNSDVCQKPTTKLAVRVSPSSGEMPTGRGVFEGEWDALVYMVVAGRYDRAGE